jgi:hypothetical protein
MTPEDLVELLREEVRKFRELKDLAGSLVATIRVPGNDGATLLQLRAAETKTLDRIAEIAR